jgi:glycyl-tRNA synthetase beta chain
VSMRPQRLSDVAKRLAAVRAFAQLPEAPALAAANKRVGNILKKSESAVEAKVKPELLQLTEEKALHSALISVAASADKYWASGDYSANLQALAALKEPVDAFFDKVMVNAEDPALKANRLGLLASLHAAMNRVADLSKLAS